MFSLPDLHVDGVAAASAVVLAYTLIAHFLYHTLATYTLPSHALTHTCSLDVLCTVPRYECYSHHQLWVVLSRKDSLRQSVWKLLQEHLFRVVGRGARQRRSCTARFGAVECGQ
jgi:hypothetical protein